MGRERRRSLPRIERLEGRVLPRAALIAISDAFAVEKDSGTSLATFHVTLDQPSATPITVDYKTVLGGTAGGTDIVPVAGTLTFAPGQTDQTISVTVNGDTVPTRDETFLVNLLPSALTPPSQAVIVDNMGLGTIVDNDPAVYTATGPFDSTFGTAGLVDQTSAAAQALAVAVDGNDRPVVVGGHAGKPATLVLARYNSNGQLDTTFGGTGVVIDGSGLSGPGVAVAVYQNGADRDKVLALTSGSTTGFGFTLHRFNNDGTPDTSFGVNGAVAVAAGVGTFGDVQPGSLLVRSVAVYQSGPEAGKILVAGSANGDLMVARFNADGTIDDTFGSLGMQFVHLKGPSSAGAVALTPAGKVLLAADTSGPPSTFLLVQLADDGSLDPTFGQGGIAVPPPPNAGAVQSNGLAFDASGNILVAGAAGKLATLARFAADGTFGGFILVAPVPGSGGDVPTTEAFNSVVVDNGKIVAAGTAQGKFGSVGFVARYNADLGPDTTFDPAGGDNVLTIAPGDGSPATARGLAQDSRGNLVVAGTAMRGAGPNFLVARLDPQRANLTVSLSATPEPVEAGGQLTYTISVTNSGDPAQFVSLTDLLPPFIHGAQLEAVPPGWTVDPAFPAGTGLVATRRLLSRADGPQTFVLVVTVDTSAPQLGQLLSTASFATATLGATLAPTSASASTTVQGHPPFAGDDAAVLLKGTPTSVDILANDGDPDPGDTIHVVSFTQPLHGTASLRPDGTLLYTPAAGFVGSDSLHYTIADREGLTATATVSFTVLGPPVFTSPATAQVALGFHGLVLDVHAVDPNVPARAVTYSLVGGDAALFTVDPTTGQLRFAPGQAAGPAGQTYQMTVVASNGLLTTAQLLTVGVKVPKPPTPTPTGGGTGPGPTPTPTPTPTGGGTVPAPTPPPATTTSPLSNDTGTLTTILTGGGQPVLPPAGSSSVLLGPTGGAGPGGPAPISAVDTRLAPGGDDLNPSGVAGGQVPVSDGSAGGYLIVPAGFQSGQRDLVQSGYAENGSNGRTGTGLGDRVARRQAVEGVPDSPAAQLTMAPVEVNLLKVISSLNDGGTDVLHFEQTLRDGTPDKPVLVVAPAPPCPPGPQAPAAAPATAQAESPDAPPARSWTWWLAGGGAAVLLIAGVVRYARPRRQSQPTTV